MVLIWQVQVASLLNNKSEYVVARKNDPPKQFLVLHYFVGMASHLKYEIRTTITSLKYSQRTKLQAESHANLIHFKSEI